jgi:hypothetical protein
LTNEKFYDTEIAPKLRELAYKCGQQGLNLLCLVEYEPGKIGETRILPAPTSFKMELPVMAAAANGNIDAFLIAARRYAAEYGHSSVFMHQLGVPEGGRDVAE